MEVARIFKNTSSVRSTVTTSDATSDTTSGTFSLSIVSGLLRKRSLSNHFKSPSDQPPQQPLIKKQKYLEIPRSPQQADGRTPLWSMKTLLALSLSAQSFFSGSGAWAEEGMWLFSKPPEKYLKDRYQFSADSQWYSHVMQSSVRVSYGGSGSFISSDGLILTNHHVADGAIDSVGKLDGKDYVKLGFQAKSLNDEKNPKDGLFVEALQKIEDVTEQVKSSITEGMDPQASENARKARISQLVADAEKQSGLKVQMVTLYQGGQYHLYYFKMYDDVRLVFAPERSVASFGGDPDNFEYPRYSLDFALLRAYENGKPAKIQHYLSLPQSPLKENDLIFVSGNPGSTQRLISYSAIEFVKNQALPFSMERLWRLESLVGNYMQRGEAQKTFSEGDYYSIANSRKVVRNMLLGLQSPQILASYKAKEEQLKRYAELNGKVEVLKAFSDIEEAKATHKKLMKSHQYIERGTAFNASAFGWARFLVRRSQELELPAGKRLEEFQPSRLKVSESTFSQPIPTYEEYEIEKLSDSLASLVADAKEASIPETWVDSVLGGQGPYARAVDLVQGTRLNDLEYRKQLLALSKQELFLVNDSMIQLAWSVDPYARAIRKAYEEKVTSVEKKSYDLIAALRFELYKDSVYPDATFTPRLAFGRVRGYTSGGKKLEPFTKIEGMYQRSQAQSGVPPFNLPESWSKAQGQINLDTPYNFVSDADIIGGNSGSPVVNVKGELVGLIFDGNKESTLSNFVYDINSNRAISVDVRAILLAIKDVYRVGYIIQELGLNTSERLK